MSLSRARSRAVAVVAALPLLVVAGPVVSAANAAEDGPLAQAVMVETLGAYRVGPNAGYRGDVARGVNGTTAIMQLDLAPAAVIETVKVKIDLGRAFSVYQNFSSIDGVAVYKDTNANGRLDAAEHAAGAVTRPGYSVSGDGTAAVVTLTADPAKATGASDYLVTVHPAASPVADRTATFTVPASGIQTSTGAVPSAPFAVQDIVIDSLAPALIPAANFTPVNRSPLAFCPPSSAEGACGDDGYVVYRGATPAEDGAKIAFFNAPGDVSDAALLIAKPAQGEIAAVPAVYDLSSVPSASTNKLELSIGNGTGRQAGVPGSKALNNQLSDDVVVAQWDLMGNIASQTFTNNNPCDEKQTDPVCPSAPLMGNDVTGVKLTSWTVKTFNNINFGTANTSAVPVTTTATGEDSARPANRKQTTIGQIRQVAVLHRLSDTDTSLYAGPQAWSAAFTPGAAQDVTSAVNASSNENYPSPSRVRGTLALIDQAGNPSADLLTAVRWRDLVRPKFSSLSLLDLDGDNKPSEGDEYRVVFDEGIEKTDVTNTNVQNALNPDNVPGAGTCNATTPQSQPCPSWGNGATVTWSTDGRMLTIKLGEQQSINGAGSSCPVAENSSEGTCRLAEAGDEVHPGTSVSDPAGNTLSNSPFIIENPTVLMHEAVGKDTAPLAKPEVFSTGRDGVLDTIDVTFTGLVDKDSITAASDAGKFTVTVPGGSTLTASAVGLGGGSTTKNMRVSFSVPANEFDLYGTSATPVVSLTDGTIVTAGTQLVGKFSRAAIDGAGPVPVSIKTHDTAPGDGKIDKVLVKYSEPVKANAENPCGYTVTGYGDSAYKPAGASQTATACPTTGTTYRNAFAVVAGQPDTVALTLKVGTANDTHATPAVNFNSTNKVPAYGPGTGPGNTSAPECNPNASLVADSTPDCPVTDGLGNGLPFFTGIAADAAAPVIVGRATADSDSDGHLDAINVTYSEPVSSPSLAFAQFQVTEPAYTVKSLDQTGDNVVQVVLQPGTDPAGDTAARPKLAALGGTTDLSDAQNATPADAAGVQVTDKAGPAIMAACVAVTFPADTPPAEKTARLGKCPEGPGDKVAVLFSEALDTTSGVVAASDFVVEQPAGTAKTVGSVAVSGAVATLTMAANNNLDGTKDAFVRLASAGAVSDNAAAPKNASTQTATIGAWAPPAVTLDLTCPTPANPGYCVDNRIDTGATGTSGVIKWRLATTPRGTTTADSDFKETVPSKYPEAGTTLTEGTHTLYLSGKDGLDRVTPEVSDSITVLYSPAIRAFQFVNSETPRLPNSYADTSTVRDGDNLSIGADAYGTDAAEWAANSAPIGGGCLAQHMSIDVRSLSGKSTDGAKAPLKCDLKTGTETPYRQMQFGVVKVAGTTKYPVGTVVKVTDSEPGSMILDGPNGTQVRRPFISVNARRSWMISDASVIKVSLSMLSALPKGANLGYRNGALLRSSTGYYYVENGVKRPVSTTQLSAWRMSTSTAYRPTSTELKGMPTGSRISGAAHPAGTFIKYSTGTIYQIVKNAQGTSVRRKVASTSALRTLVPTSQIYPALSSDSRLAVDTWLRGYRDGTLLKFSDGSFGVIARGSLRKFASPAMFNTLGYATGNALAANGNAMPRVSGQAYRVGATIDRYKITTAAIKVTNKAGTSVSLTVIPTLPGGAGIYALGTLDPVPAGWDSTR